jgi:hypothetical protein
MRDIAYWLVVGAIFVTVLAACEPQSPAPREPLVTSMALTVHFVDAATIARTAQANGDPAAERDGYTVLARRGDIARCDVYIAPLGNLGTVNQQLLGHELAHCLYGQYHP